MFLTVIPSKAGIQSNYASEGHRTLVGVLRTTYLNWIPAFAG